MLSPTGAQNALEKYTTGGDSMSSPSSILLAATATNGDAPIGLVGACAMCGDLAVAVFVLFKKT